MNVTLLLLSSASFLMALALTGIVRHYALQQQLVDIPNERSSHTLPTPRGGGLGFLLAFSLTLLITLKMAIANSLNPFYLLGILFPLAVIGFLDDRFDVPSRIRYLVQLSAAGLAVFWLGMFPQPWLAPLGNVGLVIGVVLTLIGFTALVNFYNFMDGLDGFVTTVTIIQLSFLALYLHQPMWWLLVAALLGFLYWNWSPAKIFMGDVGSTVLGAAMAIALLQSPDAATAWSGLAITLPITGDTIYTLCCRLVRRENIFQAHRTHIFQRLHQSGLSHAQVCLIYGTLTIVLASLIYWGGGRGALSGVLLTLVSIPVAELYFLNRNTAKV
ncbi:MAG: MraY family glycosyltransferase [Synechocystis sp.]